MLKLTGFASPYQTKHIWISASAITALEQAEDHTNIWTGDYCHCVTQSAEKVLEMITEAKRRARAAASTDDSVFGQIFGPR